MNPLVTGNLSLVTGDWQKPIPNVILFSISNWTFCWAATPLQS